MESTDSLRHIPLSCAVRQSNKDVAVQREGGDLSMLGLLPSRRVPLISLFALEHHGIASTSVLLHLLFFIKAALF